VSARLLHGVHPVRRALEEGQAVRRLLVVDGSVGGALRAILGAAEAAKVAVRRVPRRKLDQLCPKGSHQGVVAELPPFVYATLDQILDATVRSDVVPLVLACDRVQDPRNLGAILRTAVAFGAQAVVLPRHEAAGVTPGAERTAAGAAGAVPVARVPNLAKALDRLKDAGLWVAAASAHEGTRPDGVDLSVPLCLVLGGEAKGPRRGVLARSDLVLHLELPGEVESLNVSAAAAALLYEAWRQRSA